MRSLIEDDPEAIDIGPDGNSLDLLQAVYRSTAIALHTRMRAAMAALKHEVPALGVSFVVNDADIAARLDKALERTAIAQQNGKLIEARPEPEPAPAPVKPTQPAPLNRLYDKRHWRRF